MRFGAVVSRVLNNPLTFRIFRSSVPYVPNFYEIINEQCDVCAEAMDALVGFMETNEMERGLLVRELEKRGDEIKMRNMVVLNQAFATPMDREDIYRAIVAVDQIINYAKTTVREMEILALKPDSFALEMAQLLRDGVNALQIGFHKLNTTPALAVEDAEVVRKAERYVEKVYRKAIADLFQVDEEMRALDAREPGVILDEVVKMFKRRELYRHLSNSADQLARAGDVLYDIVVQIS
ncbi:MAG: DUF47 family protein [Magnetococcales bacterium]|nr:DUF47 family protein [Magnetococcales bacterium]